MLPLNKFRLPHLKYIQTLIVGQRTAVEIVEELTRLKLDVVPDIITKIYQDLFKQQPTIFDKVKSIDPDHDWMADLDILGMYGYRFEKSIAISKDGIQGAFKILDDSKICNIIYPLALAGISTEDIELTCTGRFDINYEPNDFIQFLHYFANFKGWTNADKELYVGTILEPTLKEHYKLALKGDKNYLLWKLGAAPNKSFDQMLREMFTDCFYYFKEKQKKEAVDAQRWGMLAVKISDRLDRIDEDSKNKKTIFDQVKFELADEKPKTEEIVDFNSIGAEIPDINNLSLPDLDTLKQKDNL
jgi:hypothetical protein